MGVACSVTFSCCARRAAVPEATALVGEGSTARNSVPSATEPARSVEKPLGGAKMVYAIFACKRAPHLVGIHVVQGWTQLRDRLPGRAFAGSGAWPCKRFVSLQEAAAFWAQRKPGETAVAQRN